MKKNWLIAKEEEYFDDTSEIIELQKCPNMSGVICKEALAGINENLKLSRKFKENKDYSKHIHELNNAFELTFSITREDCLNCVDFFRHFIYQSLETTCGELVKMNSGLFRKKKYKPALQMAQNALNDMKARMEMKRDSESIVSKNIVTDNK